MQDPGWAGWPPGREKILNEVTTMHVDTGRLATMDEVAQMKLAEASRYEALDARLSGKAARALAQGRRFPDPEKDRALFAEHVRLAGRRREQARARQRREKQARRRNRGNR